MVEYYRGRNEATCSFSQSDERKIFNVMTCAADFLDINQDNVMPLINQKEFIEYSLEHGEKNMIDLFKHFHFPVPETEEEKKDPRFFPNLLYKKGPKGNLIPRENVYYCQKHIKGYNNPFKSSFTERTKIDNKSFKQIEREDNLERMKNRIILNKSIDFLSNRVSTDATYNNKINENENSVKLLKYCLCIKYYAELFNFKELNKISSDEVSTIGQIYYLVKRAPKKNDNIDEEVYNFSIIEKRTKKEEPKESFIDELVKNFRIACDYYSYLLVKPEETQIIWGNDSQTFLNKFGKIKGDNNINNANKDLIINNNPFQINNGSKYGNVGNNVKNDDNILILILKGKRIDFTDKRGKRNINQFFFKFCLEKKLLKTVEVIFDENVVKGNTIKFNKVMRQIKFNEEIIIVFAYDPTIYSNIKYKKYELPPSAIEFVYYIDSSKENPKVIEIFNEINK